MMMRRMFRFVERLGDADCCRDEHRKLPLYNHDLHFSEQHLFALGFEHDLVECCTIFAIALHIGSDFVQDDFNKA